jgi:HSP20 family protein
MALARREGFGFELPDVFRRLFEVAPESGGWIRAEERREGDDAVVRFELPGVDPEHDVEISVVDGVLHVRAERQEKSERREDGGYRSEFRYGSFVRNVALPPGVDADDIRASYKDGILEVRIPVGKEQKPETKRIPVSRD